MTFQQLIQLKENTAMIKALLERVAALEKALADKTLRLPKRDR